MGPAAPAAGHAADHPRAAVCRNCGTPVSRNYCPECGQDTSLHPLSVGEFVQEIVSHYVAAEGKLWRTLATLALHPGRLTIEYLAGRRQRYIVPLRLYLTASFVFFAIAQIAGHVAEPAVHMRIGLNDPAPAASGADPRSAPARPASGAGGSVLIGPPDEETLDAIRAEKFEDCGKPGSNCPAMKRLLAPAILKLEADPQGTVERLGERFQHSLSYAMFVLLPVFALLLAIVYRNRRLYYGEHLVFALHVHSFWFLLALLGFVLPDAVGNRLPLGFAIYGFWALHRVYGGRWWATALRGSVLLTVYALVMGLGAAALSMALLATT